MSDNAITIYHGSNVVVEKPQIMISGFYKDFGYGFYCTNLEKHLIQSLLLRVPAYDQRVFP